VFGIESKVKVKIRITVLRMISGYSFFVFSKTPLTYPVSFYPENSTTGSLRSKSGSTTLFRGDIDGKDMGGSRLC